MDIYSKTRDGQYEGQNRLELIHKWINGRMPLIGIGSVFTADDALNAVEDVGVELVALGREILLDYDFVGKIKEGRESEIISYFDPEREDNHELPPKLWQQFNNGFILYLEKINNIFKARKDHLPMIISSFLHFYRIFGIL